MIRDRLGRLGEQVREFQDRVRQGAIEPSDDAEIHALVLRARRNANRNRRAMRIAVLVGIAATIAATLAIWPRPARLTFQVDGIAASLNSWIAAGPAQRATLAFSEGSRIELEPSTRARVVELNPKGAHIILETGLAGLRLSERPRASWAVSAGPFEVSLGGAHCDVLWEPDLESLEVVTYEGRARVSGPVVGEGRMIESGQRLSVGVREQRATLSTIDSVELTALPLPPAADLYDPGAPSAPAPTPSIPEPEPGARSAPAALPPRRP